MKTMRFATPVLAIGSALMVSACGADYIGSNDYGSGDVSTSDAAGDIIDASTADADATGDSRENDVVADVIGDDVPDGDVGPGDVIGVDTNPPFMAEREGWAWAVSPDDIDPTRVMYKHLESTSGTLTGAYADVWNCLREDGGPVQTMSWDGINYDVQLCHYQQTVIPDDDGSYLSLTPPENPRNGNDAFAEGHTYYSVNKIHDYFAETFGHTDSDRSLFVAVNVSFQILGSPGWMGLDNAAYMPDASYGFMGFNMHDGEMLAFGQGRTIDFCTDASVIFHEYTHSVVGSDRFTLNTGDEYGFSGDPPALNEGFADYFASSVLGQSLLGNYALGSDARELAEFRKCPDQYIGESHTDGQIWSSALWEIRTALGATLADQIAYGTLEACGPVTTFVEAAQNMLDVCDEIAPEQTETVRQILESHNLIACSRVLDFGTPLAEKGYYLPGTYDSYAYEFQTSVAAPFQYRVEVPEGKTGFVAYFRAEDLYGYDSSPEVKLFVKRGDDSIVWSYSSGRSSGDADRSFAGTRTNSKDVMFTIAGDCVTPGVYHIQLINKAEYSVIAQLNTIGFLDSTDTPTWDGCDWPDDPVVVEDAGDVIEPDAVVSDVVENDANAAEVYGSDN